MMFAFTMLWAYVNFSQYLIVWSGNLPEEISWYLARFRGGWGAVGSPILVFHFVLPFLLLLSRRSQPQPARCSRGGRAPLSSCASWTWLARPARRSRRACPRPLDGPGRCRRSRRPVARVLRAQPEGPAAPARQRPRASRRRSRMDTTQPAAAAHGVAVEPDRVRARVGRWRRRSSWRPFGLGAMLLVMAFFRFERRCRAEDRAAIAAAGSTAREDRLPPEPRLQIHATRDWQVFRGGRGESSCDLRLGGPLDRRGPHPHRARHGSDRRARRRSAAAAPVAAPAPGGASARQPRPSTAAVPPSPAEERGGRLAAAAAARSAALSASAAPSLAIATGSALARPPGHRARRRDAGDPLKDIGIDQRLNEPLPLDASVQRRDGRAVRLGDYFGKRPVVLALVYYNCPMLCTQVLNGLVSALRVVSLDAGRDFDVVAVSFDPRDTPATPPRRRGLPEPLQPARRRPRLALPDRRRAAIARVTKAVGLPLPLRRGAATSSRTPARSWS